VETESRSPLGQRIARQRRAALLTQEALAKAVGVTQSAVARWETGESVPALRHRRQLAEALVIAPSILFVEDAA
jgi:transcriptional regulator with XRE-family HTH domain